MQSKLPTKMKLVPLASPPPVPVLLGNGDAALANGFALLFNGRAPPAGTATVVAAVTADNDSCRCTALNSCSDTDNLRVAWDSLASWSANMSVYEVTTP